MKIKNVLEMVGNARSSFLEIGDTDKLFGMNRPLDVSERTALSYYQSVLQYLNQQGAVSQDWIANNPIPFEIADSDPEVEELENIDME